MNNKGVTLPELLAAIIIVGVLSAIALPAFIAQRNKAETAKAVSIARSMVNPLWGYRLENGKFPNDVNANIRSSGLPDGYWLDASQMPLGLIMDYNNHCDGQGNQVVHIMLLGQNGQRNTEVYEQKPENALEDDIIIPVKVEPCEGARRSIR